MAEGAPLLREYRVKSLIEGSNPSHSARHKKAPLCGVFLCLAEVRASRSQAFVGTKKNRQTISLPVSRRARPERFELPTAWFVARYSIQLSYGRVSLDAEFCTNAFHPSIT